MLSMILKTGLKTIFARYVMFSLNVEISEVSVRSFTGVANILFANQSHSTNITVFPSLYLVGKFLVYSTYIVPFFGYRSAW